MARWITISTATGIQGPTEVPPELEGKSALECVALFATRTVQVQKDSGVPETIGFRAPLTITIEED